MSLSCAKELVFFLIGCIFLLEKVVPGWEVPNTGKCRTCRTSNVLVMSSSDLGEVSHTVFLLSSVAKEEEHCSALLVHFVQANETSVCGWACGLLSLPKAPPFAEFWEFC